MTKTRNCTRLFVVLLTLALMLSCLPITAFANGSVTAATINGTTATIETVGGYNYIRTTITAASGGFTVSEYSLRHATVVLTATATPSAPGISFTYNSGVYTATDVNLFNQVYTVTVDGTSYRLAAGLKNGEITIDSNDPLKITGMTLATVTMNYRCVNVQNPYIGEPGWTMWTGLAYSAYGTLPPGTDMGSIAATINLPSGTTVSGSGLTHVSGDDYILDLINYSPVITLSNSGVTRDYYVLAYVPGGKIYVTFDINAVQNWTGTPSIASDLQDMLVGTTKTSGGTLIPLEYDSGATVYDVLVDVAYDAGFTLGVSGSGSSTYVYSIDGMAAGGQSGWMYKVNETTPGMSCGSYVLQNGSNIRWGWVQYYGQDF